MHQRDKHLRCPTCHKRMLSIPSMTVHSSQMHNIQIKAVPNALPTRSDVSVDVLGMKGIPDSYYASLAQQQHQQPTAKVPRVQSQVHAGFNSDVADAAQPHASAFGNSYAAYPQYYPQVQPQSHHPYLPVPYPPHTSYPLVPFPTNPVAYSQAHLTAPTYPARPPTYTTQLGTSQPYNPVSHQGYNRPMGPNQTSPYSRKQNHQPYVPQQPASASASTASQPSGQASASQSTSKPANESGSVQDDDKAKKVDDIKILFDRLDLSMEELRAQLPRYKVM